MAEPDDALVRELLRLLARDEAAVRDVLVASWQAALPAHGLAVAAAREAGR